MKNSLGERLRELRASLSQAEFARKIGVKQTTYSSWERGIKEPSYETLGCVSRQFGVSTDWLLGLTADRAGHSADVIAPEIASRIDGLEREVDRLRAVNAALMEAFANVGRGATIASAPATARRRSAS